MFWKRKKEDLDLRRLANVEAQLEVMKTNLNSMRGLLNRQLSTGTVRRNKKITEEKEDLPLSSSEREFLAGVPYLEDQLKTLGVNLNNLDDEEEDGIEQN